MLLWQQFIGMAIVGVWSAVCTFIIFIGLRMCNIERMSQHDELLGADWVEHNVRSETFATKLDTALSKMNLSEDEMDQTLLLVRFNKSCS